MCQATDLQNYEILQEAIETVMLCWLVFVKLTQTRVFWEEVTLIKELPLSLAYGYVCGGIFLIND